MTTETTPTGAAPSSFGVTHPLDMLTAAEIRAAREILVRRGLVEETTRFPRLLPVEPDKQAVLAHRPGSDDFDRSVVATLLETGTGRVREAVVSVTAGTVTSVRELPTAEPPYGQPPYLFEEYDRAAEIVKADPRWQAAMARRGITDTTHTFVTPLAPGFFPEEGGAGRRMMRSLTFHRRHAGDNPWAHPVEGVVAHVDLTAGEVVRLEDDGDAPVPWDDWDYTPERTGPARTSLKPLEITQPEGPSFSVEGTRVRWENWTLRIGFNAQEGLVLNRITFRDGGEDRPVVYRASVPEMVVPYGDPAPPRFWISYFDAGEYSLGKNANSLKLGCDCLGEITYFDAVVADDRGDPMPIPHAVCMHEEDYGILWKHTEPGEPSQVRRSRRLVISYFATVGNYDYGFFWYFYLDGSIQLETKATGIVFAGAAEPGTENSHAPEIAPGIIGPVHQHLFCARLDMSVDGQANSVEEENLVAVPTGPQNPHGNAFTYERSRLARESQAVRDADSETGRRWYVTSAHRRNAVGRPTSYQLTPMPGPRLMAQPGSSAANRAEFARHHLWATAYDPAERFPAGDYPNQHAGDGLGRWTRADRPLTDADVVLWHTFGLTHIPRPEDWPVMPVDYAGFWLKPHGFLDANPALDLPDWSTRSSREVGTHGGECCS
ncbi:primary-amine oxidase [Streptomonospora sp. PA3]|uniref:primary-amine oxidase n=1 Tax=Streptomonospora sp. PA3 TaxID=2607326 RepID=UPI0012DF20AF|nr:primary-amine oxidase [Streptomonospora sp. PA3]MUL43713.1 primary-amine oxidase [Streptomonospora sp. PA3]